MADTDVTERSKQETTPAGVTGSQPAERSRHPLLALRNELDRLFDERNAERLQFAGHRSTTIFFSV